MTGQKSRAQRTHCAQGHELSGDNVRITTRGRRECRKCHKRHSDNYRARQRAAGKPLSKPAPQRHTPGLRTLGHHHYQCETCGREWKAEGHMAGPVRAGADSHVAYCANRGKKAPLLERMTPYAAENYIPVPESGCWLWLGAWSRHGYGRLSMNGRHPVGAHRLFYAYHKGDVPDDLLVCHKCDTPACVNPDHLFLGTNQDNMDDMAQKGRRRSRTFGRLLPGQSARHALAISQAATSSKQGEPQE